jgi:hypothetical protein
MNILILSHTLCGSTTLCKWISKELDEIKSKKTIL